MRSIVLAFVTSYLAISAHAKPDEYRIGETYFSEEDAAFCASSQDYGDYEALMAAALESGKDLPNVVLGGHCIRPKMGFKIVITAFDQENAGVWILLIDSHGNSVTGPLGNRWWVQIPTSSFDTAEHIKAEDAAEKATQKSIKENPHWMDDIKPIDPQ